MIWEPIKRVVMKNGTKTVVFEWNADGRILLSEHEYNRNRFVSSKFARKTFDYLIKKGYQRQIPIVQNKPRKNFSFVYPLMFWIRFGLDGNRELIHLTLQKH